MKQLDRHRYEKSRTEAEHNDVLHQLEILSQRWVAAVPRPWLNPIIKFLFCCHPSCSLIFPAVGASPTFLTLRLPTSSAYLVSKAFQSRIKAHLKSPFRGSKRDTLRSSSYNRRS